MPESHRPVQELLAIAGILRPRRAEDAPVLSLGGTAAVPAENRSGAATDQQIVQLWLDAKRSTHTRRSYARDINLFNQFLAELPREGAAGKRPESLSEVTVRHLESFAAHLEREPPRTAARRLSAVKSLFTFAQQTGYLHFNVGSVVKLPGFAHDVGERILSPGEVQACVYAAPAGRDRTIIRFLYATGCRVAELARLRWEHLHYRDARLVVQLFGKGDRTRYVPIPLELRSQLEPLKQSNMSGFVFETRGGKSLVAKDVWRVVHRAAVKAGIKRPVSSHWFRHSHASHALSRGADIHVVQKTLGHTSIRTTGDYLHIERGDSSAMYLDQEMLKGEE